MRFLGAFFGRHSDVAMVVLVLGVLVVLFAPLPAGLLDLLIVTNITGALLILLADHVTCASRSTSPPFPAAAPGRHPLPARAQRLRHPAGAARRLRRRGHRRVRARSWSAATLVVGLVVFLILVVIQFVVITNGARPRRRGGRAVHPRRDARQADGIDADLNVGPHRPGRGPQRRREICSARPTSTARWTARPSSSRATRSPAIIIIAGQHHRRPRHRRAAARPGVGEALQTYTC